MSFSHQYLEETINILKGINAEEVERMAHLLAELRKREGRLFLLGVGGSAANCSHAANDFRKIAGLEAYTPTDNVAELTARTNDDGWESVFTGWLKVSRLHKQDMLFILSVGGGNPEKNVSVNLVSALKYARETGSQIVGIVGRDGGYTAKLADACVIIPSDNPSMITPHTEELQSVVLHLLVSHPLLKISQTRWESLT